MAMTNLKSSSFLGFFISLNIFQASITLYIISKFRTLSPLVFDRKAALI